MGKTAFVTGVTGQDGAYLGSLLLRKGYRVHGLYRRSSNTSGNLARIAPLLDNESFSLHEGDLLDANGLVRIIGELKPDEIYNLAAQSHVHHSFENPEYTGDVNALGTLRILEAVRSLGLEKQTKFYQASTSELFGNSMEEIQSETTPFAPRSPYAIAKLFAYWSTVCYRQSYGMYACNGILFNHESPLRGETFVTRKVTLAVADIVNGKRERLFIGNLDSKRDWGHASDYVEGMWLMLQQETPDDYVLASGETHSVREFIEFAFAEAGIEIRWNGNGLDEKGVDSKTGKTLIEIDPRYFRPNELDYLRGDPRKAVEKLGWSKKYTLEELVREMVRYDLREVPLSERLLTE